MRPPPFAEFVIVLLAGTFALSVMMGREAPGLLAVLAISVGLLLGRGGKKTS